MGGGPCILRVKRKRDQGALDQICKYALLIPIWIDLEFDRQSGELKKTKFVTEMEVIESRLSSFGLAKQEEQKSADFALGHSELKQNDAPAASQSLRLNKLRMPGAAFSGEQGKTET